MSNQESLQIFDNGDVILVGSVAPSVNESDTCQTLSPATAPITQHRDGADSTFILPHRQNLCQKDDFENGACTHLTMTRLYTTKYECMICKQQGSFGWVYRCTQDRELLVEHSMAYGDQNFFDSLPEILPKVNQPRRRNPAARADRLSLLGEISESALETYTAAQLARILKQRSDVLDKAIAGSDPASLLDQGAFITKITKPWLPQHGNECQFKCCHGCRPSMIERTYLSLNGIVNGDIPATTISGFGFHLRGFRPVVDASIAVNLGLREDSQTGVNEPPCSSTRLYFPMPRLMRGTSLRQAYSDALDTERTPSQSNSDNTATSAEPDPLWSTHVLNCDALLMHEGSVRPSNADCKYPELAGQARTEQYKGSQQSLTTMREDEEGEVRFGEAQFQLKDGFAVTK